MDIKEAMSHLRMLRRLEDVRSWLNRYYEQPYMLDEQMHVNLMAGLDSEIWKAQHRINEMIEETFRKSLPPMKPFEVDNCKFVDSKIGAIFKPRI